MRKSDLTKKINRFKGHRTVGKVARFLRRNVKGGLAYEESVKLAISHFQACGAKRILKGSKLTYQVAA